MSSFVVNLVRQTTGVHGIRGLRLQTRVLAITPCPPVIDLNGTVFHLKLWSRVHSVSSHGVTLSLSLYLSIYLSLSLSPPHFGGRCQLRIAGP